MRVRKQWIKVLLLMWAGIAAAQTVAGDAGRTPVANAAADAAGDAPGAAPSHPQGHALDSAATRQFKDAWKRLQAAEPDRPDPPALRHSVIYDYLLAARLRRDLAANPGEELDQRIDEFIQARANLPVVRGLRRDWLASLATRARWDWFLPRATEVSDPALICLKLAGRLATGDTQTLATDALARWRQPQPPPAECAPVYAWLRQQNMLTPALAEERTRAALANDNWRLAREFVNDVPAPRNIPLLQWIRLLQTPRTELEALARDAELPVEPRALTAGFAKFAIADFPAAATLLPALLARSMLPADVKAQLQRAAALGASYSRNLDAVTAFDQVPAAQVDSQVQEWRARAALWAGNYERALVWIEDMPTDLATQPRWRYWHARAVEKVNGPEAAKPLYAELAGVRDYYGYLAADRIQAHYELNAKSLAADTAMQRKLEKDPGLKRAKALFDADLYDEATVEWAVAMADADAAMRTQAALLASRWGWYAQSIATLAQLGSWDDVKLRYPRPFARAVAKASERTGVAGDWIYAVMRQESLYRAQAVSGAGARGLMQVLPSTAKALAKKWKLTLPADDPLFQPDIAVLLGAAHLKELLDDYNGALPLSLAAYNAGAVPVARWLPQQEKEADVWIENIPYTETRSYVQRVMEHIVAFAWVRRAKLPELSAMMPKVGGQR